MFSLYAQECTCVSFCSKVQQDLAKNIQQQYNQILHPVKGHEEQPSQCLAGYQDGTMRMFDFGRMKMVLKAKPHSCKVPAITASFDGRIVFSRLLHYLSRDIFFHRKEVFFITIFSSQLAVK